MYSNNGKRSNTDETDREKAPGGGPIILKDPSKRDVYSGNNPRMYEPYRPSTEMYGTNTQGSLGSGYKKQ